MQVCRFTRPSSVLKLISTTSCLFIQLTECAVESFESPASFPGRRDKEWRSRRRRQQRILTEIIRRLGSPTDASRPSPIELYNCQPAPKKRPDLPSIEPSDRAGLVHPPVPSNGQMERPRSVCKNVSIRRERLTFQRNHFVDAR